MSGSKESIHVAVIGCGHWGKNHVRVLSELGVLAAINDHCAEIALRCAKDHDVSIMSFSEIIESKAIQAIVIATPAETHFELARDAILAGKHVFVEKPLALKIEDGRQLCELANLHDRILFVGHLLQYHSAFQKLKSITVERQLGNIQYIYSNRLNLGKFRQEESILWSFAPHDISMIISLIGDMPSEIFATGANYLQREVSDVTTTHMKFPGGQHAHIFVSWLHPFKDQKMVLF